MTGCVKGITSTAYDNAKREVTRRVKALGTRGQVKKAVNEVAEAAKLGIPIDTQVSDADLLTPLKCTGCLSWRQRWWTYVHRTGRWSWLRRCLMISLVCVTC